MGLDALVDKADEILRHCPLAERGEARLLEPIRKLLEVLQAVELGVTFWDTSDMYGFGANERLLATVLDEAMVWSATWAGKRFCVAGELNTRFRAGASPGTCQLPW